MKYFFDTEFNENVEPIDLISMGVVSEEGREFYWVDRYYAQAANPTAPKEQVSGVKNACNVWVRDNVLPILFTPNGEGEEFRALVSTPNELKNDLVDFIGQDQAPQFWAYYAAHDWYLLTRLFKSFDKMPSKWPQAVYDLHQYARHIGLHRDLPAKFKPTHNALVDARWTRHAFEKVHSLREQKGQVWP